MIDLHCHILPGLDDGARDMADSVAMARQAADDGIEIVCATPHIRFDHDVRIHQLAERVAQLQSELSRQDVPVEIAVGGEVAQSAAAELDQEELGQVSLGGSGAWVLLEPDPGPLDQRLYGVVEHLRERGVRAVVAHPERHADQDLTVHLRELVQRDCLIQWTAEFVAAGPAQDIVLACARDGLVHLLGSDSHSSLAGRPVRLAAGYERLRAACTDEQVRWMAADGPAALLQGQPVTPPW